MTKKDFTYDRVEYADIMENGGEELFLFGRIESADILVCCVPEADLSMKTLVPYAVN